MGNKAETNFSNMQSRDFRNVVQQGLFGELYEHGPSKAYVVSLIDDYMNFWDIKNSLIQDIQKRGIMVKWKNGEKQSGYKKNDSISELIRVNTQMMKILQQLNIKAAVLHEDPEEDY